MKTFRIIFSMVLLSLVSSFQGQACTGITLRAKDSSIVVARTVEWGNSILKSDYIIVPRGYHISILSKDGAASEHSSITCKYGFVGISVMQPEFVVDGMNEAGLTAGLFFFPNYGSYERKEDDTCAQNHTKLSNGNLALADMQFVSWVLASYTTVDEVITNMDRVRIVSLSPQIGTVHWRVADASGRQIVIEIIDGIVNIHDNPIGVLTNSPSFDWHLTNLNNYINLHPGNAHSWDIAKGLRLNSFGAGTAMLGLPGDITPPSRFVRAAFFVSSAPQYSTAEETVVQSFHILNNFDIPIGVEFEKIEDTMPMSATQWTTAASIKDCKFYYRTFVNMNIRCIDLKTIDFSFVQYQVHPLDKVSSQPIEYLQH